MGNWKQLRVTDQFMSNGNVITCRVLAAAAKRSGQENEGKSVACLNYVTYSYSVLVSTWYWKLQLISGLNEKADNESDGAKRDRLMPDICVICLEQEYNAVFVP